MSYLSWVDFDPEDRKRSQEIINLFKQPDARDELGLASIRDGLSDLLFPATSTIQTRLRYMLFIPWVYQIAQSEKHSHEDRIKASRRMENELAIALEAGGMKTNVIGSDAGKNLKRLPSSVYWSALDTLGIRKTKGSSQTYLTYGPSDMARMKADLWNPNLPEPPKGFLAETSFELTDGEGAFLKDLLEDKVKDSLLAELVRLKVPLDDPDAFKWPWNLRDLPLHSKNQALLKHAERYSTVMYGAQMLYNLMLAERALENERAQKHGDAQELIEQYTKAIADWTKELPGLEIEYWNLESLFSEIRKTTHRLHDRTTSFIQLWVKAVLDEPNIGTKESRARVLVMTRELQTKAKKARLHFNGPLERWSGASSTGRMGFRWNIARQHIEDIRLATQ